MSNQEINKMIQDNFEYNLEEWSNLDDTERLNIINHYWDPYDPRKGLKTKSGLIDEFIKTSKISARQFGIKSFGWAVYMIFVVVDNSQQKVPTKYLGLPINKGVIISQNNNNVMVRFNYGGTMEVDLDNEIVIG